ncbi:MAG: nuclear transport factor 2 family protein [Pseudomonadota bacterium]|nr:nuclear transport factor 2 family protein [Pseudomonadota bacterium]
MINNDPSEAAAIKARILQKRESYLRCDADGALDVWLKSERICCFDLGAALQYFGYQALHTTTHQMVAGAVGPIDIDFGDPTIMVSSNLACSWQILRVKAAQKGGRVTDIQVRQTDVWNKVDGRWYIVHEHNSLPMQPGAAEAMLSLSDETMSKHPQKKL